MGKTGSIKYGRIKGRKGQVRMVPESELTFKRPGPVQRYSANGSKRRRMKRSSKAIVKG